ncbi:MAG: Xanthine and CO dehydrogenases maturation factor, XdhC/CoxF family, partial [uncultured Nocardioidaceae bacterium]
GDRGQLGRRPWAARVPGLGADRRGGLRRRGRPARDRPQRGAQLWSRRRAARGGDPGLRLGVRAAAADDRLRGHRLRRRGGPDGRVPRLPRHGLRRPPGVRHRDPVPLGGRGRGHLAAQVPRGGGGRRPRRRAHRALRAHPRPQVRRPAARGGAAPARGRLRRGDGVAAHPRGPAGPAPGRRARRGRARPAVLPGRARPRGAHPGGDRGEHRRRGHRAAVGRERRPVVGLLRPDPPRPL